LAKIAVELERAVSERAARGWAAQNPIPRVFAQGAGWRVADLICTSGPQDRPFEEQHSQVSIAIVLAGTFQYRTPDSSRTGELMTPGSLLLGNPGQCFECDHRHGTGDRCLSFSYAPEYFALVASHAGSATGRRPFPTPRLPLLRALSPLISEIVIAQMEAQPAREQGGATNLTLALAWEEFAIQLAASALQLADSARRCLADALPSTMARVTRAVRTIENQADSDLTIARLAREAGLSPYHFLRSFAQLTGVTPHQYLLRARLREAATRLATQTASVLEIALDCGFGDVSNFNRAFRKEFGTHPRGFRRRGLAASG
jgi:AraC-like DNA-binding protein